MSERDPDDGTNVAVFVVLGVIVSIVLYATLFTIYFF